MPKLSQKEFAELVRSMPGASDDEIVAAAKQREAENDEGIVQKVWRKANEPLTTLPSKAGAAVANAVDQRSLDDDERVGLPGLPTPFSKGQVKGFVAGAAEGAGNVLTNLTSPFNLALTALGFGAEAAGARGALGISRAARNAEAALQAPLVAEGAHSAYEGVKEGDFGKAGAGALEAALGAAGVKNAATHTFPVQQVAEAYNKSAGLPRERAAAHEPVSVNPEFAKQTADAYEAMPHTPDDPKVAAAYKQLATEIENQFAFITQKAGVKMEPWTGQGQPYANSAEMVADVQKNNHLFYFPTEQGYGAAGESVQHPMLNISERFGVPINDLFRAVHDYFGHAKQGFQFGPKGEENAYLSHRGTLSDDAIPALTSETRGQNSYVNFGRHLRRDDGSIPAKGEPGFVPPAERPFAEQKAGLLPEQFQVRAPGRMEPSAQAVPETPAVGSQAIGAASAASSAISPKPASRGIGTGATSASAPAYDLGTAAVNVGQLTAKDGGSTFNLYKGSLSGTDHYAVSVYPERGVVVDGQASPEQIAQFVQQNADLLQDPKNSIGTWFNKEDGKTYLDISVTTPNLDDALRLAQEKNQLAIFDLKNFEEIKTPQSGVTGAAQATTPMAGNVPPEFHAVEPQTAPKMSSGGVKAMALAGPALMTDPVMDKALDAMGVEDPQKREQFKRYGRIGLAMLSAGAVMAGVRGRQVPELSPQKALAERGAAALWLGGQEGFAKELGEHASPEMFAAAQKIVDRHLATTANQLANTKKLIALSKHGDADISWYDKTGDELRTMFGDDAEIVARFLAATSNNATVASNASLALKALRQYKTGQPFEGYLPVVKQNLEAAVKGESFGELGGRKVDNFVKALIGDPDAVVVDRWIMRAFGFMKGTAPTDLQYDFMENTIRQLAKQQGVAPRQLQAAIWFATKNAAEQGKKRPASPPMEVALSQAQGRYDASQAKAARKAERAAAKGQNLPF